MNDASLSSDLHDDGVLRCCASGDVGQDAGQKVPYLAVTWVCALISYGLDFGMDMKKQ